MGLQHDTPGTTGTAHAEMMRCVVDEGGEVVFASPALSWHVGSNTSEVLSRPIDQILRVVSGDYPVPVSITDIQSGFYETALQRKGRDPLVVKSRIDNIGLPDGRRYIVFWVDPDSRTESALMHDPAELAGYETTALELANIASRFVSRKRVSRQMQQKLMRETASLSVPRLGHISQDDGELRHFLNLSNDLLAVYRRDGSFVRVNFAFNRVLGYTDDDLRQIPFIDLIHPEDREYVCVEMNKLTAVAETEEKRVDFQARARCKDRGWRWIEWIQKAVGGHIYIIGSDITDRKQHEAELRQQEQQLCEAQKIGRMGHWYWVVKDSHIDWSDNLYEIFGVKRGEFEPSLENIKTLMPAEDAQAILKAFRRSIREGKDCVLEFRISPGGTGDVRYIHCEGRCKTDEKSGKVKALFGIMQDITERKCHERALNEAKEAAETAYASKTRFLANMSHELRTPLNAVIGFSQMMQQQLLGPLGNDRYLDYISGIRESGEHLLNLINDILDMSKIEVGKYELEKEDFNLSKLVQLAVHMVETRANDGNIRLIADNVPENVTVHADRRAVMQIMLNLLSNAVKFTADGGEVEISCRQGEELVMISVRDTGFGIPEEKIELVTLPFEQVSSAMTRDHEGSGLGLAITKELVEMHNGRLGIKSKIGEGTTVTVLLPQHY